MSQNQKKCTLADVGKAAGLSVATVSLALRNDSRIPEGTRAQVRKVAAELGYERDPMIAKLMTQLRNRRKTRFQGTIVALYHPPFPSQYVLRLIEAASRCAAALGYKLVTEQVASRREKQREAESAIIHRGIEALLLLPSDIPVDLTHAANWDRYAAVAAGHNPVHPQFHRIAVNWFDAVKQCGAALRAKGYSRVGYVVGINYDFLSRQFLSGAVSLEMSYHRSNAIRPLYYSPSSGIGDSDFLCPKYADFLATNLVHPATGLKIAPLVEGLMPWYSEYRPDVLVLDREETAEEIGGLFRSRALELPPIATISRSPSSNLPGVCLPAEEIGKKAVSLLDHLIRHGASGLPDRHAATSVEGQWMD